MPKKSILMYILIAVLFTLLLWQWASKSMLSNQVISLDKQSKLLQNHNNQLSRLSGIGPLKSTHIHADVRVYINGQSINFSQEKYQLATSYIHFEDRIGDVVHIHATGMTIANLFRSLNGDLANNCMMLEGQSYCNGGSRKLKFYVNGKPSNEFGNHVMEDFDKILVSYGAESNSEIQKQIESITNLAPQYSGKEMPPRK